ncbi:MAG TPA: hypothetical protein EYP63_07130 [Desulfotomaculum sp.]|nr:hypothetical protein [Desulfotomaculum sp.]
MEKGLEKSRREGIVEVLNERFGVIGPEIAKKLEAVEEVAVLISLHRRSLKVSTLAEFSALLDEVKVQGLSRVCHGEVSRGQLFRTEAPSPSSRPGWIRFRSKMVNSTRFLQRD